MPSSCSSRTRRPRSRSTSQKPKHDTEVFAQKGYVIIKRIGGGSYGQVYKAQHIRSKEVCAVKVLDTLKMNEHVTLKFLPRELACMISAKHENVVRVWDIFRSKHKVFIFMEFASNGDISSYMKRNAGLTTEQAATWFLQSCRGLDYLHSRLKVTHRDLKLDNIMLFETFVAKLIDFGFARKAIDSRTNQIQLSHTYCGTAAYNCPNRLTFQPYDPFKSDVYSMGIVLFTMLHNRFPFHLQSAQELLAEVLDYPDFIRSRFKSDLAPEGRQLIESMIHPIESKRCTLRDVLNNKWLDQLAPSKSSSSSSSKSLSNSSNSKIKNKKTST